MNKSELKNKVAAIFLDSVREKMHAALTKSGGLSDEQIADLLLPWDTALAALAGETDTEKLGLEGRFADAVRVLVERHEEEGAFETPEDELAELKCGLRLAFLHQDADVRSSGMQLLRFEAERSAA